MSDWWLHGKAYLHTKGTWIWQQISVCNTLHTIIEWAHTVMSWYVLNCSDIALSMISLSACVWLCTWQCQTCCCAIPTHLTWIDLIISMGFWLLCFGQFSCCCLLIREVHVLYFIGLYSVYSVLWSSDSDIHLISPIKSAVHQRSLMCGWYIGLISPNGFHLLYLSFLLSLRLCIPFSLSLPSCLSVSLSLNSWQTDNN